MPTETTTGLFVWHELMSVDHKAATKFYQILFGWDIEVVDMGEPVGNYTMLKSEGNMIGGILPLDAAKEQPSHWISYINVDDVDAACEKMKRLGGTISHEPFDIPNVGRTAVAADPTGAHFSPFKGISEADNEPPAPAAGMFTWHELMSTDIDKAKPFYTEVMGWGLGNMDMGKMGTYWLFKAGGIDIAGGIQMPADAGEKAASNWLPYVGVKDVPEIAKKTKDLGGSIYVPPRKLGEPSNVHFAVLAAPDGSMFGIVEVS